jgi:hypothetical protein
MTFWDKVINQNKMDSSLISELSDLSYKSIGGKRQEPRGAKEDIVNIGSIPFEATITPDRITKEMIMDYQKNKDRGYIDPLTNTEYKYIPTGMNLDVVDLIPKYKDDVNLGRPPNKDDVRNYRINRGKLINALRKARIDLAQTIEKIKVSEELINFGRKKPYKKAGVVQYNPITPTERTGEEAKLATNQTAKIMIENDIKQLEADIEQDRLNAEEASKLIEENKGIEIQQARDNKENLFKYKEGLKILNTGRMNFLEREPNESEAQFLTRMKNIETERYDTNLHQEKARLDQVVRLKLNLKNIIRKDEIIENIVKSFTAEQIFLINKNFAGIQQHFIENFGFDNPNLTTNDIVDEIVNILDKILNPPTAYEIQSETITTAPVKSIQIVVIKDASGMDVNTDFEAGVDDGNTYLINNTTTNKHIFFKIGQKNKNVVFYSTTLNSQGSFVAVRERSPPREETLTYLLFEFLGMDKKVLDKVFKGHQNINGIYEVLEKDYGLQPITDIKTYKLQTRRVFGWGISHPDEEIPTYAKFGNLVILLNKLFYKNILSLKTKTGHTIDGFKNTKVSDTLVEIIMKMYRDENVDGLIKNLSSNETNIFNSILFMAGLHKKFKSKHNDTLGELKEKFKVCEGQIVSGNNNPEVLKELKEILLKLHHLNAISIPAIKKYLKQFN